MFFISLAILIVALLGALRPRSERSIWFKYIFIFSIIIIFASNFYFSYQQYQTWLKNDVSKHLLPPYASINYFLFYSFTRFFAPYLISLAAAILFFFSAKILNKKYEERFFEPEEYYFGALSIFLLSHPGWLFYLVFLIIAYLLIHLYSLLISSLLNRSGRTRIGRIARKNAEENKEQQEGIRISLRYLWIPIAIFVIIISGWLSNLSIWQLLKF